MGLLDGDLQRMFGAAFAKLLLEGRHYKRIEERDNKGNVAAVISKVQSVVAFCQSLSKTEAASGYSPDTAVLVILQTYQGRLIAPPVRDDRVQLDGTMWVLGNLIEEDAGHVSWRFAATPAAD